MSTPDETAPQRASGAPAPATPQGGAGEAPSGESLPGAAFDLSDLDRDIAAPRVRRRRLPLLTALLASCAIAGAGVVGGILIQKHWGGSTGGGGNAAAFAALRTAGATASATGTTGATGATGAAGAAGGRGFGGFGDNTIGTVKAIDGSTLYVTDTSGNTIKVTTQAGIPVRVTKNGTIQDVHPGDTVVVQGTKTGGVVTATSVTIGGAGGGLGGGPGGGFRRSNGGGSTGGSSQPALPGLGG